MKSLCIVAFFSIVCLGVIWDLGIWSKKQKSENSIKIALRRSLLWFVSGLSFAILIFFFYDDFLAIHSMDSLQHYANRYNLPIGSFQSLETGLNTFAKTSALNYLSGYLIEYALSIDNLFVMLLIFQSFKVNLENQKRILLFGIIGAIVLRFLFIYLGSEVIHRFHWVMYIFACILIYSGFKMGFSSNAESMDPSTNFIARFARKCLPLAADNPAETRFYFRVDGKRVFSSLFLVLLIVELTDLVFAVDSVPAILSISTDPYIVFSSNIFAIMGLRSLYFVLGAGIDRFYALKGGLSFILIYIGLKIVFEEYAKSYGFTAFHNLILIIGILGLSIFWSVIFPKPSQK